MEEQHENYELDIDADTSDLNRWSENSPCYAARVQLVYKIIPVHCQSPINRFGLKQHDRVKCRELLYQIEQGLGTAIGRPKLNKQTS